MRLVGAVCLGGLLLGGWLFLGGVGLIVIGLVGGFFEFPHGFAQTFGEFGELFGAEEQDDDREDQQHLGRAQAEDGQRQVGKSIHRRGEGYACAPSEARGKALADVTQGADGAKTTSSPICGCPASKRAPKVRPRK